MKYLVKRLTYLFPTMVLVSLIIFWLMRILPGDVAALVLVGPELEGAPTPQELEMMRRKLGLDKPLMVQYATWVLGMVRADVGNSLWTDRPVFGEIFRRLPLTTELGLLSTTLSVLIAVPLGIVAAIKRGSWVDVLARCFALGGMSIPNFWVGILIILLLVSYFGWTPPLGYTSLFENPWRNLQQLVLPALALGYSGAAVMSRLVRSSLLEVMREDYIRTARSKGVVEKDVIFKHALRNALLPLITVLGLSLAGIIGGTTIMETVFSLPGMGRYMVDAINFRDYPVVQTLTFIFALIYALANLGVDLAYSVIDPRIRLT